MDYRRSVDFRAKLTTQIICHLVLIAVRHSFIMHNDTVANVWAGNVHTVINGTSYPCWCANVDWLYYVAVYVAYMESTRSSAVVEADIDSAC